MFKRIMVANRGEIAMRVIRCCREMGIETVLAVSEEDKNTLPAQYSTHSVCIGPAPASASYLNTDAIISAAKAYKCSAIHPGYGFLSENAAFAEECEKNGIVFIGPDAGIIRQMGNKQAARALMKKHKVPVVPGSDGLLENAAHAAKVAKKIGYPVLIKASSGGGGRGMRVVKHESELEKAYEEAGAEAGAAFGDSSLYMEKLILNPRHIEVQILGDKKGNIIHLGERDCSMQRRNQKLIEEAPARCLSKSQRSALYSAALKAAGAVNYVNAGTVEFVLDENGSFYFIEMNTRVQVEHPVTEAVTGIDIVREQIRIAAGRELSVKQSELKIRGHAIECRINAEDPEKNFAPSPGDISFLHLPGGMGVRCESALFQGAKVSPYYDSMIAKIIVHAPGRMKAIKKMRAALEEMTVEGLSTNLNFLYLVLFNPGFVGGSYNTSFLAKYADALIKWDKRAR